MGTWRYAARRTVLLSVLGVVAACGPDGEASRSDTEQCRDMVDTYCAKNAECAPASERVNRGRDCEFNLTLLTPCEQSLVRGDMAWCLESINAVDCRSFDATTTAPPWPDACKGILGSR